ncbi:hypothetical protein C8035_v004252 [Colletotrichum spinosum]|uniref:Uncharacterized protein n=1 Tax=Colletotrichum spinosum TaxID=1347390 RepID=A0A4R8Q3H4_9PEZI|nr:hypothetical protein C8035_v004252 [Colletotrichum spinosum]
MTIFKPYKLDMNISFMKSAGKYKNYRYFYKGLKGLVLYKSNFITFSSLFQVVIAIFTLKRLWED